MARSKPLAVSPEPPPPEATSTPEPAPEPKIRKCCGTCEGWRKHHIMDSFGFCIPSGRAGAAPIMTPDLASCTLWPAENFKTR